MLLGLFSRVTRFWFVRHEARFHGEPRSVFQASCVSAECSSSRRRRRSSSSLWPRELSEGSLVVHSVYRRLLGAAALYIHKRAEDSGARLRARRVSRWVPQISNTSVITDRLVC